MADDMQMDVEPSFEQPLLQPVVDSNQGNPFFQWQTQNNPQLMDSFAMPSHHQDNSEAYKQAAYISTENSPAESQIPMPDGMYHLPYLKIAYFAAVFAPSDAPCWYPLI